MFFVSGDAFSPLLVGALAVVLWPDDTTYEGMFQGLRFALYCSCFVAVLGGLFFLLASLFLPEDKQNVLKRSKLEQVRHDVIDEHLDQQQREEEQYQRELYRQKTEAAAAGKPQNGGYHHNEAVLMHYVRKTSKDGEVNTGYYPDDDEDGVAVAGMAKLAKRVRPVSQI